MSEFIKPREFVRRFVAPHLLIPTNVSDQLIQELKEITDLLREGKAKEVIEKFDKEAGTDELPENKRHYIGIASAYLQLGKNLERAGRLHEAAMSFYKKEGELAKYAICCAHRARVAYRMGEGYKKAMEWYQRAWDADTGCVTAWANAFCHTSLEQLEKELEDLVNNFVKNVPNFTEIPRLRQFFREDAQIAWARRQKTFHHAIMKKLDNREGEDNQDST